MPAGTSATEPTASVGSAHQGEEEDEVTAEERVARGPRQAGGQGGRRASGHSPSDGAVGAWDEAGLSRGAAARMGAIHCPRGSAAFSPSPFLGSLQSLMLIISAAPNAAEQHP